MGLVAARVALSRGFAVTVLSREAVSDTTSFMAAGMVAPAQEALNDPDPVEAFARYKAAQKAWYDLLPLWPESLQKALQTHSLSRFVGTDAEVAQAELTLHAMGAAFAAKDGGLEIEGENLFDAGETINALKAQIIELGAQWRIGEAVKVDKTGVILDDGAIISADHYYWATGLQSPQLWGQEAVLQPIKGHLLVLPPLEAFGVERSKIGYLAHLGGFTVFGATMQAGQDDRAIEAEQVDILKTRARQMGVSDEALNEAIPRVGVRAATLDGQPIMATHNGHWIAVGMRRNGFLFAPKAADILIKN